MDYAWSSVETLILLMVNLPVVSVVWLCLITSVYCASCMEPFRGKLEACLGVCLKRESLCFVGTAPLQFWEVAAWCKVWERQVTGCRSPSRPTMWDGIKKFKDRYPYSSILSQRNMNNSWPLIEVTKNIHSAFHRTSVPSFLSEDFITLSINLLLHPVRRTLGYVVKIFIPDLMQTKNMTFGFWGPKNCVFKWMLLVYIFFVTSRVPSKVGQIFLAYHNFLLWYYKV